MKYRQLSSSGDYTFGMGGGNFYQDVPAAVAQAVMTRLKLFEGEWFLDTTYGTPYDSQILGAGTISTYDAAIQQVILETQGVASIATYTSGVDPRTRAAAVNCAINTQYGQAQIAINL
jgi:hypothetical protein